MDTSRPKLCPSIHREFHNKSSFSSDSWYFQIVGSVTTQTFVMAATCVLIRNKDNAIIHSFFLNIHICLSKYKNLHNYLLATYLLCPLTSKDPPLRPLADASVFYVCSLKEDTSIKVCFFCGRTQRSGYQKYSKPPFLQIIFAQKWYKLDKMDNKTVKF